MPLTREQKQEQVAAITEALQAHNTVYLTDYQGLTVEQVNQLRSAFHKADIQFRVFKNTLLRRAMEDLGDGNYAELFAHLEGPTAVALTNDPARPGKVLKKFLENNDLPKLKAAYVDGAYFGEDALDQLAALKSKDELIADILGLLMAPITNVASALGAQGSGLASVIQQISEKEEA